MGAKLPDMLAKDARDAADTADRLRLLLRLANSEIARLDKLAARYKMRWQRAAEAALRRQAEIDRLRARIGEKTAAGAARPSLIARLFS